MEKTRTYHPCFSGALGPLSYPYLKGEIKPNTFRQIYKRASPKMVTNVTTPKISKPFKKPEKSRAVSDLTSPLARGENELTNGVCQKAYRADPPGKKGKKVVHPFVPPPGWGLFESGPPLLSAGQAEFLPGAFLLTFFFPGKRSLSE
jgi:hypothetical protein